MTRYLAAAGAVALLLAGCSSSATGARAGGATGAITVAAASSLTEAFTTLKSRFEKAHPGAHVTLDFGASSDLATQIQQGKAVDVFASASEKNMKALRASAIGPVDFAANTLEIAVPPANPAKITGVADLARSGTKIAVCEPAVPCGVVAAKVFANAGVHVAPSASLPEVKSVLAAVESGEVDAGLVYVTDVRAAGTKAKGIPIPAGVNASTTYPIARLKDAHNPTLATAWVQYVRSAAGRTVLRADGFQLP